MKFLLIGLALVSGLAATAQPAAPTFTSACHDQGSNSDQVRFCETRDLTLPAPTSGTLTLEGGQNGGLTVRGWDGPDVRVRALVQTWGTTEAEAQAQAKALSISATGDALRTTGDAQHAAVSFEVFVPRRTSLALTTNNGGISLVGIQGTINFHTQNGGVSLTDLSGQVSGNATNGGLSIHLNGRQWEGTGLDVSTTNGGISWYVPADYSARFFTSTSGGGITTTLPVSSSEARHKEVSVELGGGGQLIKAVTDNGGITIKRPPGRRIGQ